MRSLLIVGGAVVAFLALQGRAKRGEERGELERAIQESTARAVGAGLNVVSFTSAELANLLEVPRAANGEPAKAGSY